MSLRKPTNFALLFIADFCNIIVQAMLTWVYYEIAGVENGNGSLYTTSLKSQRFDRTTYAVSGTFEIFEDLSNNWEFDIVLLYSAKGNNQFVKLPYKVPKSDLCKIMDGIYITSGAAKAVADTSDLPAPPETGYLCKLYKKGIYSFKQFILRKEIIPKFTQIGLYNVQLISSKKSSGEVLKFGLFVKLY